VIEELNTTTGIVALVAGGLALLALILAGALAIRLRRVRSDQSAVLGGRERRDLVTHASRLEAAFVELRDWVEESLGRLDDRVGSAEGRIDGCVAHRALVRYDAYGEMSGRQSSSVALLDAHRSGVVVSSILHRDQARVYVKQVHEGEAEFELSPEEQEAVDTALRWAPA
jgi:hypothetical protein